MGGLLVLGAILSLFVGLSLGLLGGGGSILTVPILAYVLGVEPKSAIAISLFVVGITSSVAMMTHARAGNVRFRIGAVFGVAGMVGAFLGGRVAHFIPGSVLLLAFGIMMLAAASAMMRDRKDSGAKQAVRSLPLANVMGQGAAVGFVTGLIGAGGGFVVVPALVLLGGLPMRAAVGTSLLVITMNSLSAFAGYLGHVSIDWFLTLVVTVFAVIGSVMGGKVAVRVSQQSLKKVYGWFILAMGLFMVVRQLMSLFAS